MCGIVGFLEPTARRSDTALTEIAKRMSGTLQHRGPDDGGAWSDAPAGIAFGFRRLSIEGLLNENRLKREGIFNPEPIRRRWARHVSGERDRQYDLRVVLMFQAWRARWMP